MSASPKTGIQISTFLVVTTIVLPLLLVGADMLSDGGVLAQMWPYTRFAKDLAGADSGDEARLNSTAPWILAYLFLVSIIVLEFSTGNLLRSNPLATLVRNARTTVMMNSRELERKDVPVPLGNN